MGKKAGLLFILFVLYAGIRLVPFFFVFDSPARFFLPGSSAYNEIGANLAQHSSYVRGQPGKVPAVPPGYPFFLSLIYRAFGVKPAIALFFQIALSGLIPVFLYLDAEILFSKRIARIASVLSVFEPLSLVYDSTLLPWTLGALLLLMCTYFLIVSMKRKDSTAFFIAAITAGAAAYLLSSMLYCPLVSAVAYLAASRLRPWNRLTYTVGTIVIAGLTLVPWAVRNYAVSGYKGFSQAPVVTLRGTTGLLSSPLHRDLSRLVGVRPGPARPVLQGRSVQNGGRRPLAGPSVIRDVILYHDVFTVFIVTLAVIGIIVVAGEGFLRELAVLLLFMLYIVTVSEGPAAGTGHRLMALPYLLILTAAGISALFTSVASKHYKKRIR